MVRWGMLNGVILGRAAGGAGGASGGDLSGDGHGSVPEMRRGIPLRYIVSIRSFKLACSM